MQFYENNLYHIYNRGNNRDRLFFTNDNYLFFLKKVRRHILPHCKILAYCLMPNHFHFLVYTTSQSTKRNQVADKEVNVLSEGFRHLLSGYTQAINKQEKRTGSLFTQNTKAKQLRATGRLPLICFNYIHQNPLKAGLVTRMQDWDYSSFRDYAGLRNGTLCDKELAKELLQIHTETFIEDSKAAILFDTEKKLW